MSRAIRRRVQAKRDVIELADHIARDSITAARRFRENVRSSLKDLLAMPEIGELFHSSNPTFRGMRWWQVKDFPNHLIF